MVEKAKTQRQKPVRRPLKVRLDEAKKRIDRIERSLETAKAKYGQLHAKYLKTELKEKVDAIKEKFKRGDSLSDEEMDILRKVM